MWKPINFAKFVELQQGMVIAATGKLENKKTGKLEGYWMEWAKPSKMGFAGTKRELRLEERPHVQLPMDEMELYFKKG